MSSVSIGEEMSIALFLDPIDRLITRLSPFGLGILGVSCGYYVAFSYGVGVVMMVLGKEQSAQLFGNAVENPLKIVIGVPMIPVALITLEALDMEGRCGVCVCQYSFNPSCVICFGVHA